MGASDVRAILWEGYMDVCVCEGSLQPQLRRNDVILCKSHINTTQTYCLGPGSLSLHYGCINIYIYLCIFFHRTLTAEPSTNILPYQLLCSSHYSEFQGKESPGKRCIWLAPWMDGKEKGKMNHVHEAQSSLFMALRFFFPDGSLVYFKPKVLSSKMT